MDSGIVVVPKRRKHQGESSPGNGLTMADLSRLPEKLFANEGYTLKSPDFVSDLTNKKFDFLAVIQSLSDVLTNTDTAIRERGVDFMSWVLAEVPQNLFSEKEIRPIVNFYIDRLKDHHNVIPATIRGLLALVKMTNTDKDSITQILSHLFQEINCQTQHPTDRYNILSIVRHVVESETSVAAGMGRDFVLGVISVADGETDPSNLLLLFQFLPRLLATIDLDHLMEEMFDLLSCYFPIDFNSAGKNLAITREDLSEELMKCLAAKPDFADHCLPLIVEKLESTLKVARIDSYKLLGTCCSTYAVDSIAKRWNELWRIIQKDVLPAVDGEIAVVALYALSEMVKLFAASPDPTILKNFLDDVLTSIRTLLNKVEDTLFNPAVNVLLAISCKSTPAAEYVLNHLKFIFDADAVRTPTQRRIALAALKPFIPTMRTCATSITPEVSRFFIDSIGAKDADVERLALGGVAELVPELGEELRAELLDAIGRCLKSEKRDDMRNESLKVLRRLAEAAPAEVHDLLQMHFQSDSDVDALAHALSTIADVEALTQHAVPKLISIACGSHSDIGLTALLNCCRTVAGDEFFKRAHAEFNVTDRLIAWWLDNSRSYEEDASTEKVSEIVALIVRRQDAAVQQSVADAFVLGLLADLEERPQNVFLLEAVLGSVRPSVRLDNYQSLYVVLTTLAVRSPKEDVRTTASRLLASIINKTGSVADFLLGDIMSSPELLSWVVKGLLLCNSDRLESTVTEWFRLLERDDVGERVADGFRIVLTEDPLYLNFSSHCNVKILYRQRFFTYFPRLLSMYEAASETTKENHLVALMRLVEGVPKHVTSSDVPGVVLVSAQALGSRRLDVVAAGLAVLRGFLEDRDAYLTSYAQTLVPKFLNLSRCDGGMRVRIAALTCLFLYAFYPTHSIIPLKSQVIRGLESSLDDRKRLVRWEAVKARNRWYLVGAPGEDAVFPS